MRPVRRLGDLAERVRRGGRHTEPVRGADRASILTEESNRPDCAARSGAEARVTFHRAWSELTKTLSRDREDGVDPLSSDFGPLSAGDDAAAEGPPEAAVVAEPAPAVAAVAAGLEGERAGPAGAGRPLPAGTDPGPPPTRSQEDGLFNSEPENRIGRMTLMQNESITSVDARVPDPGCAETRKTGRKPRQSPRKREQRARVILCFAGPGGPHGPSARRARPLAGVDPKPPERVRGPAPGIGPSEVTDEQ